MGQNKCEEQFHYQKNGNSNFYRQQPIHGLEAQFIGKCDRVKND